MWPTKEEKQNQDRQDAQIELTKWRAVKTLVKNNILAAEIDICGIKLGLCNNSELLPAINHNIKEIQKFLKGEPNELE